MYRYDMKDKTPQQQVIVRKHDEENVRLKQESKDIQKVREKNTGYEKSIFMRLGKNPTTDWDGEKTIETYKEFCKVNSSVWFPTDSLNRGMAKEKIKDFKNAIKNGHQVYIYFAIGNVGNGTNEIKYRANILDLESGIQIPSPDKSLTPNPWADDLKKYLDKNT